MTRRQVFTEIQRTWLQNQVDGFLKARAAKGTKEYVNSKIREFLTQWPTTPNEEELAEAENDQNRALHLSRANRGNQIVHWFNNHTRDFTSGTGARQLLKLSGPPKLVQPWQAYQNLFWETELKQRVETEWTAYQATFPPGMAPDKSHFSFRNQKIQEWYEAASDEVKARVEEHRVVMKTNHGSEGTEAEKYQRAIDKLPRTLEAAAQSIANQTGWNVTIIAGGPCPRINGQLTTLVVHEGLSKSNKNYGTYLGEKYTPDFLEPFADFLLSCFDKETQMARSLTVSNDMLCDEEEEAAATMEGSPESTTQSNSAKTGLGLCEYETTCTANIERNNVLLQQLGLDSDGAKFDSKRQRNASKPKPQDKKKAGATKTRHSTRGKKGESELGKTFEAMHNDAEPQAPIDAKTTGSDEAKENALDNSAGVNMSRHTQPTNPAAAAPAHDLDNSIATSLTKSREEMEPAHGTGQCTTELERDSAAQNMPNPTKDNLEQEQPGRGHAVDSTVSSNSPSKGPVYTSSNPEEQLEHDAPATVPASSWYRGWLKLFQEASIDYRWVNLIAQWSRFEALGPNEGKFPIKSRPEEVGWWIRRHRALTNLPVIEDVNEYATNWKSWWVDMQLEWRNGTVLARDMPEDFDWPEFKKGGESGFGLVVMTLAWWMRALKDNGDLFFGDTGLAVMIEDVAWVLGQVSTSLLASGDNVTGLNGNSKRANPISPDKPRSKRLRSAV